MENELTELLACPYDHFWPLSAEAAGLRCPRCDRHYPVRDGIATFLTDDQLSEQDKREQAMRDEESSWYDAMFEGYTNAVEVPTAVRRVGSPRGPILDAGCGTGRITEALTALGQPIVALDYSAVCLRRMLDRCKGHPIAPVQADLRALPVRTESMHAVTCIEVYSQLRGWEFRKAFLAELARTMITGAPLSISAFNYNVIFKVWNRLGNRGAREGEHMLGGDYYYRRFESDEFRRELSELFDVEELTGVRNIPARSLAQGVRRTGLKSGGDRLLQFMVDKGYKADFALERTPLSRLTGFFWQAKAVKPA